MGYFATAFFQMWENPKPDPGWAAAVTRNQNKKIPFPKTGTGNENGLMNNND